MTEDEQKQQSLIHGWMAKAAAIRAELEAVRAERDAVVQMCVLSYPNEWWSFIGHFGRVPFLDMRRSLSKTDAEAAVLKAATSDRPTFWWRRDPLCNIATSGPVPGMADESLRNRIGNADKLRAELARVRAERDRLFAVVVDEFPYDTALDYLRGDDHRMTTVADVAEILAKVDRERRDR